MKHQQQRAVTREGAHKLSSCTPPQNWGLMSSDPLTSYIEGEGAGGEGGVGGGLPMIFAL